MNRAITILLAFSAAYHVGIVYASPDLCSSDPDACEYTGPGAPDWDSDVCWSTSSETMYPPDVAGGCPSGHSLYYAEHAEIVNEVYGDMIAYYELDDACSVPGICVAGPPPSGAENQLLCCDTWGLCVPLADVPCNNRGDQRLLCYNGVSNLDGTVTCFEGQPY